MKFTVTIARQLGCGGSEIGQLIASELGVRCIDREIVSRTASRCGLSESEIEAREEKMGSFWERMLHGFYVAPVDAAYVPTPVQTLSDKEIFLEETEVLKRIAAEEDCVIVGRGAGQMLESHSRMVNLLLHAPLKFRIARLLNIRPELSAEQARDNIENSDAMRAKSIAVMTGKAWASALNYHMTLDTSLLPLPETAGLLTDYIRRRVGAAA